MAFAASALALSLGACSSGSEQADGNASRNAMAQANAASSTDAPGNDANRAAPVPAPSPKSPVIGLEGLGELRIGQPVPKDGSWAEHGAQTGESCRTVSSPQFPGVYAIVTDGKVQRITVGKQSDVTLAEGIGVGATEADVRKWFAGFREEPHKYEDAPAKYLTAPNASNGSSALRFEIGHDGRVSLIHIGLMPVLAYVEGCA